MEIYVLRHAIAEPRRPGRPDAERKLTPDGKAKLGNVLARARATKVAPARILTSPLVRALETAEIAAQALECPNKIVRTDALLPGASPRDVWREICARKNEAALMLAGHEPMLSATVAYLLGTPSLVLDFKKGALVRLDCDRFDGPPHATLKWILTPALAG